jgi:hypothetical protein
MTTAHSSAIIVEISDRRLPVRMVAQRLRADMRDVPVARPRLRARRGALAAVVMTLTALLAPARLRHAA